MNLTKAKSFTLSELLVVMIITVIVVGIAFSVLNLVQGQIRVIEKNFGKTTQLSLFEQRIRQDFNKYNTIICTGNNLRLLSDIDTINYTFTNEFCLRNNDTIPLILIIGKLQYEGKEVKSGYIDAISISASKELPGYSIFVSRENDAVTIMNKDGL